MPKVLVADDCPDNASLLSARLKDDGHEVIVADDGIEALQRVGESAPDIVLLGVIMPRMNGLAVCRALRRDGKFADPPVIMLSTSRLDDDIIDALDCGAHDYVIKPFSYPVLAARMRSALRQRDTLLDLKRANEHLRQLSRTDPLTGLCNRRWFIEQAEQALRRIRRSGAGLCLLLIDVDRFKHINDRFGHDTGDRVLTRLAGQLAANCRDVDVPARLGGEEFALCLHDTDSSGGQCVAERIRRLIENLDFGGNDGHRIRITVSIGIADVLPTHPSITDAMQIADAALYRAKEQGRNKVAG